MDNNICKICGSHYSNCGSAELELCASCLAKSFGDFWISDKNWHVTMHSDGNQFVAQIQAGIEGETFLSVGYSSPNYAWIKESDIENLSNALNAAYNKMEELDLDLMLPQLYELCQIANRIYNGHTS